MMEKYRYEYEYEKEEPLVVQRDIDFFIQNRKKGQSFRSHIHSAVEVLFIQTGTMKIFVEGQEFMACPGSTVLIRSNTVHTGVSMGDEECNYWVLKIKPTYLYDISFKDRSGWYLLDFTLNRIGKKILWSAEESRNSGIADAVERMIRETQEREYGYDIALKTYSSQIILSLLRGMQDGRRDPDEGERTVRNVYDTMIWISEHYAEDLTAEMCAARCYLSYSYFSRTFRRITGKSFRAYLNEVRIDHAERKLVSTRKPITLVATDCGFNNTAYFISVFREHKGMTPLAFRKEYGMR